MLVVFVSPSVEVLINALDLLAAQFYANFNLDIISKFGAGGLCQSFSGSVEKRARLAAAS